MTINEAIKELRSRLKQTQPDFAKAIGVQISAVTRYEKTDKPSASAMARIAVIALENGHTDVAETLNNANIRRVDMYSRSMIRHALPLVGLLEGAFLAFIHAKTDQERQDAIQFHQEKAISLKELIDNVQLNPFANRPKERTSTEVGDK